MNNVIIYLLNEVKQSGIRLAVWKNRNKIEESLTGGFNIDVLVQEKDKPRLELILSQFGFFEADSKQKSFPGITHYFRLTAGELLHIHLYYRLVTGESSLKEYDLPLVDYVLEQTCDDEKFGINVVNDQAAVYLFILRHYLKSGSLVGRRSYKKKILEEKEDCGVNDDMLMSAKFASDPLGIVPLIKKEEIVGGGIPSLASSLRIKWYLRSYQRRSSLYFVFKRNLPVILHKLGIGQSIKKKKKLLRPTGAVIAITGSEATGKSTMVAKVINNLAAQFEVVYAHVGKPPIYFTTFLGALMRIVKGLKQNNNSISNEKNCSDPEKPHKNLNDTRLITRVMNIAKSLEVALSRLILTNRLTNKASRGSLVITDRWPSMNSGKMDGARINPTDGLIERLASCCEMWIYNKMPAADLAIILSVPLDVALERNAQRDKVGKETSDQVMARHSNNRHTLPKAKRIERYSNEGSLDTSFIDIIEMINEQLAKSSKDSKIK